MRRTALLLMLSVSAAVQAQDVADPVTLTERSQAQARTVLDRAVNAAGGVSSLRAIESVRYRFEGEIWRRLQAPTPTPPFDAGIQQETVFLDLRNDRLRAERRDNFAGEETHDTLVIDPTSITSFDHRSKAVASLAPQLRRRYAPYYRRLPQLLLRQALDNASSLRYLGRDEFEGRPHEVLTFVASGEQLSLFIDPRSNLISKYEVLSVDPLAGEAAVELVFSDYEKGSPRKWQEREAGAVVANYRVQTEIDPPVSDATFQVQHENYVSVEPTPPLTEEVEQLAEGVYLMRNVSGRNQHSLAVAFKDHVLVVESQGSSDAGEKLLARIKQTLPGKPIRYIAMTHHHGDHIGGLRSFIAEGATVITTPGNRQLVQAFAQAPHSDRLRERPRTPELLIVDKRKRVLSDGSRTVELIDIGPNPHAREMLIAYLPRERLLFEADVFTRPSTSRPIRPAQELTVHFAKRVRELGLEVDRIIGAHGRPATASEFTELTGLEL